jgi:nucleotide-binding universal stress UspA family protein
MMSKKPYVVVAGVDFSAEATRALRVAFGQAVQRVPAELHVVYACMAVNPDPTVSLAPVAGFTGLPVLSMDEQRQRLTKYLDEELADHPELAKAEIRVFGHVLVDTPSLGISRLASELEADLIVIGTHGLHGVARWLLGSVAEGVVRQAPCPILVVPPEPGKLQVPAIEPPCPRCVAARQASQGADLWCEQHRERHGRRHTYYQADRGAAETNMPLVVR